MAAKQSTASGPLRGVSAFRRDVLVATASMDHPNGLDVRERLEQHYGDVLSPRIYQAMNDLIDMGLIEKRKVDGRTNAYIVTAEGERAVRADLDWREELLR